MPRGNFHNLPAGATISITKDGQTVTPPVAGSGDKSVTLTVNRSTGFAPVAYWFEATAIGFDVDRPEHDLLFKWDFDDDGAVYGNLSGRLSVLPVFQDRNVAFGPWVSHVYRKPGQYNVQCAVYDSPSAAPIYSEVVTVTVEDPDEVFPIGNTVYASTGTDFTGVPAGAIKLTTTSANTAMNAAPSPRRIKFKRGDVFEGLGTKRNWGRTLIEDWGDSGADQPEFISTGSSIRDPFDQASIRNITARGGYSSVTLETTAPDATWGIWESARGNVVYDNCKAISSTGGFSFNVELSNRPESSVAMLDCEITDWLDYGIYAGFRYGAIHGCWVHQDIDAIKKNPDSIGGAALRIERTSNPNGVGFTHFSGTDCFMNFAGKFTGDQPPFKMQGDALRDARFNFDRQITEGSTNTNQGVGSTVPERQNVIYDKMIHIATAQCGLPLSIQNSGTTVRNFYYVVPHVPFEKGGINPYLIGMNPSGSSQENKDGPFHASGITVVHWQDWDTQAGLNDVPFTLNNAPNAFGETIYSNSIIHAPFAITPQVAAIDISTELPGLIAFYKGRKKVDENGGALQTQYASAETFTFGGYTNQPIFALPKPTGANLTADAGAADKLPFDYIDGTLRGSNPAKGAFKP